jgi:Ser/Thr protein kinase RdoA (MazF antagonist)
MFEELSTHPFRVTALGKRLGRIHAELHTQQSQVDISFLPTVHDVVRNGIQSANITDAAKAVALEQLSGLSHMDILCHGDFHPGNVMLGTTGDTVIDWVNVVRGNPLADVVKTRLLLTLDSLPTDQRLRNLFNFLRLPLFRGYWSGYSSVNRIDDTWKLWVLPLAAARLSEDISTERPGLLRLIEKYTPQRSS